MGLNYRTIS